MSKSNPSLFRYLNPCFSVKYSRVIHLVFALNVLASPAANAEKMLSIGVSVSDMGNPYFVKIANGAKAKARELSGGEVNIKLVSSAYDTERQVAQIDRFIEQKVDMILLVAASYQGVADAVNRAQKAGIKVIAVDVQAQGADATVTTDNTQAGRIACHYLANKMGLAGKVVIINGPPVSSIIARVNGCKAELAKYPEIVVLSQDKNAGASRSGGLETMTYLLTRYPHIDGVFTINDPTALGVEQAAHLAKRREFTVVSVDGAPAARHRMAEADTVIVATASQFPTRMAERAVEIGYQLMQGVSVSAEPVLIPSELITSENISDFSEW